MDEVSENMSSQFRMECGNHTDEDLELISSFNYWLEGVLMIIVGIFGLVGNSVSILVLASREMRNSFNYFLIVLSTTDNLFIFITLLDYSFTRVFSWPIDFDSEVYAIFFPRVFYPLNNISMTLSIFLVMVITHERYIAVCHPHAYRQNEAEGGGTRVLICTCIVLIPAIIINIPKFFETELTFEDSVDNEGLFNNYTVSYDVTDLRKNPNYIRFYVNWCLLVFTGIIPLAFLLFFNYKIFQGIRYTHARCRKSRSGEINLAAILVCIVVVFVVCNLLRVVLNVFELFWLDNIFRCGDEFMHAAWFHCLNSISHLLLVLNSSSNFLIYCSLGTNFKLVLRKVFNRICRVKERTNLETKQNDMDMDILGVAEQTVQNINAISAVSAVSAVHSNGIIETSL
ncbi:FMRFamide receptor [Eurytemora carolleeae]|uniref:FMRFamide receptor n=1 Tax=Eurytemora carolleeae TaxID=1294199 RepID=UPI000C790CEC|nr:FMRFamide receptor [Eurytemora carolleeae]|eukprot:XP_023333119.1 FMRFamide receptor-like [Eurytemora affinis]